MNAKRTKPVRSSRWCPTLLLTLVASLALPLASPSLVNAQSSAAAEQLFEDGRRLMKAKKVAAACEKFAASQRLDPALGTLLNLANCREKEGRIATAWSLFIEAAERAKRAKERKREAFARKRAKALEPRLPRVRIIAPTTTGISVTMNGQPVDPGVLGAVVPVDPGTLQVGASAPGHEPFHRKVTAQESKTVEVRIPELVETKVDTPTPAVGDPAILPKAFPTSDKPAAASSQDVGRGRRITGLAVGAVGLVSAGVGLGFGAKARGNWSDAFDSGGCERDSKICYTDEGEALASSARSAALTSTILVGVGVAALAAGTVLYFTAPSTRDGVQLSASVGPQDALVVLRGGF